MAAVEVPQTLEYRGGQLNAAPILEVENFTNWKKRFLCHIIGIEPQFKNIISKIICSSQCMKNTLRRDLLRCPLILPHNKFTIMKTHLRHLQLSLDHEFPPIVTTSNEQTSPISMNEADELNQEDFADFNGNTIFVPYDAPNFKEAESLTTTPDPSNMHKLHYV
ncbi:hypothetical protein Tco_1477086 [Tanacetum coccineum]